jgi:hypothetical protein
VQSSELLGSRTSATFRGRNLYRFSAAGIRPSSRLFLPPRRLSDWQGIRADCRFDILFQKRGG